MHDQSESARLCLRAAEQLGNNAVTIENAPKEENEGSFGSHVLPLL